MRINVDQVLVLWGDVPWASPRPSSTSHDPSDRERQVSDLFFTGLADEAGRDIESQIAATRELGWSHIEALDEPFDRTLGEVTWSIHRMQRLGTPLVRIMSFAVRRTESGDLLSDQREDERFRRLREIHALFADAGLTAVHENCMNYGGMGPVFTERLLENVPGMKLVFDTGNPVHSEDYGSRPKEDGTYPKQSAWDFYRQVREHVVYVQVKDGRMLQGEEHVHTWPGEGDGDVHRILKDMMSRGYDGGVSIEPHLASVFHDPAHGSSQEEAMRSSYVEYGRRIMRMVDQIRAELGQTPND